MLGSDPGAYDLVITDQTMPRMSGLQLAGRIARLSPAPPVIYSTPAMPTTSLVLIWRLGA